MKHKKKTVFEIGFRGTHLVHEISFYDHLLIDDLDRNVLTIVCVYGQLDLREHAFSDCPNQLVLPNAVCVSHSETNSVPSRQLLYVQAL